MAKDKFVDANLVKIRDRLSEPRNDVVKENGNPVQENSSNNSYRSSASSSPAKNEQNNNNAVANERDWKKAVFRRWDEFKNTKKDIITRLAERIAVIPDEIRELESNTEELKKAEEKYIKLLADIEKLDDSEWNRHNFTSELAGGLKKLENARIEFLMMSSKSASRMAGINVIENKGSAGFIHELNSLSFKQCFRIGMFFFLPLIYGIIFAVILWGIIFYFSTH